MSKRPMNPKTKKKLFIGIGTGVLLLLLIFFLLFMLQSSQEGDLCCVLELGTVKTPRGYPWNQARV